MLKQSHEGWRHSALACMEELDVETQVDAQMRLLQGGSELILHASGRNCFHPVRH